MSLNIFTGGFAEDVWDDTELVEHFDMALAESRKSRGSEVLVADPPGPWQPIHEGERELQNVLSNGTSEQKPLILNSENSNKSVTFSETTTSGPSWRAGASCRTIFSEDNEEYEAKIVEFLDPSTCIVRFVGYGNEERVDISDLKPSAGKRARDIQRVAALQLLSPSTQNPSNGTGEQISPTELDESTVGETGNLAVAGTSSSNPTTPFEFDDLRNGLGRVTYSTFDATPSSELQPEPQHRRRLPLLKARKNHPQKKNPGGSANAHAHSSKSVHIEHSRPKRGVPVSPSSEEDEVEDESQEQFEPPPQACRQDWMRAFPNLMMPPLPLSLASPNGGYNYGKGQLASLLSSWYVGGYHAGYFDAKQDLKKKAMIMKAKTARAKSNDTNSNSQD